MIRSAYLTTGLAIKALSGLSRARVAVHGTDNIPESPTIFAINHFTRIETLLLPYHIFRVTNMPVWSLADAELFQGPLGTFLDSNGAVSTKNPDRDILIVKTLLTGEAHWIVFPEGQMVKSKKVYEKGGTRKRFMVAREKGSHPPHTGAASLALRTEFYRQRIRRMEEQNPGEAQRLLDLFQISAIREISEQNVSIVPVNLTYYPIRARENILSNMASNLLGDLPSRFMEEIMTEGTMLISGVDVDIRFGEPISVARYLKSNRIQKDICTTSKINFDEPIASRSILRKSAVKIMERYMSAIYGMTTVNHDHLFASVLKFMQASEIDESDFRRRVYLLATRYQRKMPFFRHRSLQEDQIHLLTDDRFGKYANFIELAEEKGILKRQNGRLIKVPEFKSSEEFHQVRIHNPVAVIANEVEPLPELQEKCRKIATESWIRVRYWVVRNLVERALFEFDRDYTQYFKEGESKPHHVGMPFLLKGRKDKTGVVLVHGYMAAPMEVAELAKYLNGKGYWVYVPRLKGHGTSPDDLSRAKYSDWVDGVDAGYALVRNLCPRVVIGGFSTGAGLALDLSARLPDVSGVFAVSPPLRLLDFSTRFVPAVDLWNRIMSKVRLDSVKKEFVENNPENPDINYSRNPISGVRELEQFMDIVESKLPEIKVPAVVIQGRGDPVVNPKGAIRVFEHLGTDNKELYILNFNRHGILIGDGSERVFQLISNFIDGCQATDLERKSEDE